MVSDHQRACRGGRPLGTRQSPREAKWKVTTRKHVVVLGDGVLGASIAEAVAARGAEVTVIGSGPGNGATWRSFGWLGAAQEVPDSYHKLRLLSLDRYRKMADHRPYDAAVRFSGAFAWELTGQSVQLIQGAEETEDISETFSRLRGLGHNVELLDRAAVLRREPALSPRALPEDGVLFARDEGWVDLPSYVGLLMADVLRLGGSYVLDSAARVVYQGKRCVVRLSDGSEVTGDRIVVATGAATTSVLAEVGVDVPNRSTKAALLFLRPSTLQFRALIRTPFGSLRPRAGGGAVVHTSVVESALQPRVDGGFDVDPASVERALDQLAQLFAAGPAPALDAIATGWRPIPGDGWSVAGELEDRPNCHVAFTHSGATLGPIIGELTAAELLEDGYRSPLLDEYRPERFQAVGT